MDASRLSIADDCAQWLQPHDLEAGREDLSNRLATLEASFMACQHLWQKCKIGTAVIVGMSALYGLASIPLGNWGSAEAGLQGGALTFAVAAIVWNLPALVQQLPIRWASYKPFDDPMLDSLREYLAQLVASGRSVYDEDGDIVEPEALKCDWALLYLSYRKALHSYPVTAGFGLKLKNYKRGLYVTAPSQPPALSDKADLSPMIIVVDKRTAITTINQHFTTTELHTHFHFVTQLRKDLSKANRVGRTVDPEPESSVAKYRRWPCAFEQDDYEIRLSIFSTKTLKDYPKVKPNQIKKYIVAVDGARQHWSIKPETSIEELAKMLGPTIAQNSDNRAGLDNSDSIDWIRSVIGGTGKYAFIKEAFESIQYDPEGSDCVQYRMLFR